MAVIAHAEHAIGLGPGAGSAGGQLVYGSSPADLARQCDSVTGRFLADVLVSP
ncbi:daunorubicin resistance protein [Corynebacterium marquesiae]|uniref:daunorubicin resistance protein n=1 Tax=Corynebacterium marquesiae TaxID=2913503 RepID=UPI003B52C808